MDESQTVASVLNKALESKGETIEYIYNSFISQKKKELKNTTKSEIKSWFNGKGYPNLEQMYQLAYIIPIDPTYVWNLKLQEEKKGLKSPKNRTSFVYLLDRFISEHQFLLLCLLYSFIFTSVFFVASAVKLFLSATDYNEEQSKYYVEGAIDAGAEYAENITGDNTILDNYKVNITEEDQNKVDQMRNWLENK